MAFDVYYIVGCIPAPLMIESMGSFGFDTNQ